MREIYQQSVTNVFQVDVPLEVVHLTDEYWDKVVSKIYLEYIFVVNSEVRISVYGYNEQKLIIITLTDN